MSLPIESDQKQTRKRRWPIVLVVILIVVGLIVAGFVWADGQARAYAEGRIADEVTASLGTAVVDPVQVTIGGTSFLYQYATGTLDSVTLSSTQIMAGDVPLDVSMTGEGVPTDTTKPIDHVSGRIILDQAGANTWLNEQTELTGMLAFNDGSITYDDSVKVLGFPVAITLGFDVAAEGTTVTLTPNDVTFGNAVGFDLQAVLRAIGMETIPVCVAELLPVGTSLTSLVTTPDQVTLIFGADDVVLDDSALLTQGTCGA